MALSRPRQDCRRAALKELNAEIALQRAARQEARANFIARLKLGAMPPTPSSRPASSCASTM